MLFVYGTRLKPKSSSLIFPSNFGMIWLSSQLKAFYFSFFGGNETWIFSCKVLQFVLFFLPKCSHFCMGLTNSNNLKIIFLLFCPWLFLSLFLECWVLLISLLVFKQHFWVPKIWKCKFLFTSTQSRRDGITLYCKKS